MRNWLARIQSIFSLLSVVAFLGGLTLITVMLGSFVFVPLTASYGNALLVATIYAATMYAVYKVVDSRYLRMQKTWIDAIQTLRKDLATELTKIARSVKRG